MGVSDFGAGLRSVFFIQVDRVLWPDAPESLGAQLKDIAVLFEPAVARLVAATGRATSFVTRADRRYLAQVERLIGAKLPLVRVSGNGEPERQETPRESSADSRHRRPRRRSRRPRRSGASAAQ